MDGFADLHVHTRHSDGSLTVEEVLSLARERGMRAIAVSDHDDVGGVEAAVEAGPRHGVEVVAAVEISVTERTHEYHVLGYGIDPREPALLALLARGRAARRATEREMVARLPEVGIAITAEEVASYRHDPARGGWPLLNLLLDRGHVRDIAQYFSIFGPGRPGYAAYRGCTLAEAIAAIRGAGGVAVLAHPGHYWRLSADAALSDEETERFVAAGIEGIEAHAIVHTAEETDRWTAFGRARGLVVTGGSDCHGRRLGGQPRLGKIKVGYDAVLALRERMPRR